LSEGTKRYISAKSFILPHHLPRRAMVLIHLFLQTSIALIILVEFPLVEIPIKTSHDFASHSTCLENITSKP
jgi:hypothetical protein